MTEQQHSTEPVPTNGKVKKGIPSGCIISLEIAAIVILLVLIYNTLAPFLESYRQSRELEQEKAELEQNHVKWESQHITHYRMSLELPYSSHNYGRMPMIVEVKDNKLVSVVDARGEIVSPADDDDTMHDYPQAFTVPGLFAIAGDWIRKKPPDMRVSYDPTLGYPTDIHIDPWMEPCCQDFDYIVKNLQVLPP